ncbi:UDP-N-acetylmuramoyl-L-alanyl-D-glutamate--2,6-diaminopimelate ligase [Rickettsiales bacterium]|nr:UDP-N-acetylmuramoyl-L-alanyl-D-glutamate--2,6-diaminopimelate ligase [Rickettsiales bacterium]MDB2550726.1 UDP-N-acetylmuramoyl-L-alanyl-D-glutamate--2,6-diaminopimelate ligase [Rickettsiales bacterium]
MLLKNIINISEDINITNIEIDSRKITKGGLFFALKGVANHGRDFIEQAIKNGAIAVICQEEKNTIITKNNIKIYNRSDAFDLLINSLQILYPQLPKNIFAVTGTNGKSSICHFIFQLLDFLYLKSASLGTLGVNCNIKIDNLSPSSLTTSDIITLYRNLNILARNGVDNIALEASSLGIEQNRLAGIKISLAAFSNFTQDHLDLHKTMENYFNAKMLLFNNLMNDNSYAILNSDIKEFGAIKEICQKKNHKIYSYGNNGKLIKLLNAKENEAGFDLKLQIADNIYNCNIKEVANFQIDNILCALSCVISYYNLDQTKIEFLLQKLPDLTSVTGRMQKIAELPNSAKIFIDYAHTPDAIENILINAKKISHNKLHILFGAGGNRDKGKRPLMANIASKFADKIIITDDNPRFEDASQIRKDILLNCDKSKTIEVADRVEAIKFAIKNLNENDILIIAGKGHETYQIIGDTKKDLDEKKIVAEIVNL